MDFNAYRNKSTYPSKSEFTTVYVYKKGKVIYNGPLLEWENQQENQQEEVFVERNFNKIEYRKALAEYMKEDNRLYKQFEKDLAVEFGVEYNKKAFLVFDKAWERSHSEGLEAVYYTYADLVELIQ